MTNDWKEKEKDELKNATEFKNIIEDLENITYKHALFVQ